MKNSISSKENTIQGSENTDFLVHAIEQLTHIETISMIDQPIQVDIEERDIITNPYNEDLWCKYFSEVDEGQKEEVFRTLNFLFTKFEGLFSQIQEKFNITQRDLLGAISNRLSDQIQEANLSGRKFTNGTIGSLKKIEKNGNFILEKIPYWAFGAVNVSLDLIKFDTNTGEKTLREIMETIGNQDKNGEFYLPNSLGVSVLIQLHDGTVIAQKRNNKKVLTQYAGLTASASGAVSTFDLQNGGIELLKSNVISEITEEVGIEINNASYIPEKLNINGSIQSCLLRELHINADSGILMPLGIVMERKRHNPEVVFTMILEESVNFEEIEKKWEQADDKWESIGLVGINEGKIKDDIEYFFHNIPDNLKDDPIGLEKFIQTLPKDQDWIGPHFLMSELAWLKTLGKIKTTYNKRILDSIK